MDKLKVGVLGLGRGITHLRNFLALDEVEVVGAADRFPERQERSQALIESMGKKARVVAEYDDLLEMGCDAIAVSSNGKVQVAHSVAAMDAGCHVLSEVPSAYTQAELVELKDAVERTGKTYMLGENACYFDFLRYWRKWVIEDRFGPISLGEAEYLHYLPHTLRTVEGGYITPSHARAEGIADAVPDWRADQPPIQYLTHDLGPLLEVLDDRVTTVTCMSAPWRSEETPLRSDGQIALFQTQKGSLLKVMVTLSTRRPEEHRYRLFGTGGSVEWFKYEGFCRRFTRDAEGGSGWERVDIGIAARDDDTSTGHGGTDLKVARHFAQTVLEGKPSPIDVYRTIEYALPGILADKSAELGGVPVAVPDMRRTPFDGTAFWDTIPLPDTEPDGTPYEAGA